MYFTALIYYVYTVKSFTCVVTLSERLHSTEKFPEKFWKFGNLPRVILGILGGSPLSNSFLRLYVGVYTTFVINSSGRAPRNFGGSPTFCQKISKFWKILENFGKFWKILENFGNFWKFFGKMSRRKKILEIFGNFWKIFQKL
jgi:hypothetical protein